MRNKEGFTPKEYAYAHVLNVIKELHSGQLQFLDVENNSALFTTKALEHIEKIYNELSNRIKDVDVAALPEVHVVNQGVKEIRLRV